MRCSAVLVGGAVMGAIAACGSGTTATPTGHGGGSGGIVTTVSSGSGSGINTPPAGSQPAQGNELFAYEATGQSSSPNFTVPSAGTYTVTYHVVGTSDQPNCTVTIALVSDQGETKRILGSPVTLQPGQTSDGSSSQQLAAGGWRFQEGGGCDWKVTVAKAG
jgi:hypothetical protein